MTDRVFAPFTTEQVKSLNGYQNAGVFHPFTCANRTELLHIWWDKRDLGQLRATTKGWLCPECEYTQDWAWAWMADGSWRRHVDSWQARLRRGAEESAGDSAVPKEPRGSASRGARHQGPSTTNG